MRASTAIRAGLGLTALLFVLGILWFFQVRDPMVLIGALQLSVYGWVVLLVIHLMTHGIPVRIVTDERRP